MRILFDHGTPRGLARGLSGHTVLTAYQKGWDRLKNGELLRAAEDDAFDVFLTTDRRIQYQQNLRNRKIAIVVLIGSTRWSRVRLHLDAIVACVEVAQAGSYSEVEISFR
jgi:hypothetical protein